jgi:ribosomal protein L20A (L18A)
MKLYETQGTFKHRGEAQKFTKIVKAKDEKEANELVYCLLGGKQKIPRRNIEVTSVVEAKK